MDVLSLTKFEMLAIVISVVLGTGAYIGIVHLKKKAKIDLAFILSVLFINFWVTYMLSEFLKSRGWGQFRGWSLPLIACFGVYLMEWIDKRYLKIFDVTAGKMGLDVDKNNDDEKDIEENPDQQKGDNN